MEPSLDRAAPYRLCVVGPGRHSPVLGAVTEHVMSVLCPAWELSNIQAAVPGDQYDSTLIGMYSPALIDVPGLSNVVGQSALVFGRRVQRFLLRERPDAILFELWSTDQADTLSVLTKVAGRLGVPVIVRCAGRLDPSPVRGRVRRLIETLEACELVVTCGYMPPVLAGAHCRWWSLPEWKTEERQVDPDAVEVLAFLPAVDQGELTAVMRAFEGLSDTRAHRYELHVLRYADDEEPAVERSVGHAHHHHSARIRLATRWLDDTELDRRVQRAGMVLIFDADETSRALDAATFHGTPTLLVRGSGATGTAGVYCGAIECDRDPASILVGIERSNLARKFRYPRPSEWQRGAQRLSDRVATVVDGMVRDRQRVTSGVS